MCSLGIEPTTLALLTQCSTAEPQEHTVLQEHTVAQWFASFNHAKPHVPFIMFMFYLLDRTTQMCVSCFRAVQIWLLEYNYLILTTGCSTWHLMAKIALRIWELELLLSTKMAEAIRSSVTNWNGVTVQWPGSYRGFPRLVSLGTGLARVDQRRRVLVLCIRCSSGELHAQED